MYIDIWLLNSSEKNYSAKVTSGLRYVLLKRAQVTSDLSSIA